MAYGNWATSGQQARCSVELKHAEGLLASGTLLGLRFRVSGLMKECPRFKLLLVVDSLKP